jgi:hypothetical protein
MELWLPWKLLVGSYSRLYKYDISNTEGRSTGGIGRIRGPHPWSNYLFRIRITSIDYVVTVVVVLTLTLMSVILP